MVWKCTETYRIFVSPLCLVPYSLVLLVTKYSRFWIVFKVVFCSYPYRHSVQLLWNVFRFSPIPIVTKYGRFWIVFKILRYFFYLGQRPYHTILR